MVLYIDACVRKNSRTRRLADCLLNTLNAPYTRLRLEECVFPTVDEANVVGITFRYTPEGIPEGLCRAERLYYVTTAGGEFFPEQYGFGYIQALAQNFYHIKDVKLIKATGLDIEGATVEKILQDCEEKIRR